MLLTARFRRSKGDLELTPVANKRLPGDVPPALSDEFGSDETRQRLWREFLRRLQIEDAPGDFGEVVANVRHRVWPVITQAKRLATP